MTKHTILIVDDVADNIHLLTDVLGDEYTIKASLNGATALKICQQPSKPDLILLDVMMPEVDGHEVCRKLKADPTTKSIPIIFITANSEVSDETLGLSLGAVDYITKPISPAIVKSRVRTHLALYDQTRVLNKKVLERTKALTQTQTKIIERLGKAAEYKDNETGMHVIRMSHYAHILAIASGMDALEADLLKQAAPMHDIGKIGIPDHILCKPGRLTDDERVEMQKHAEIGADIIGDDDSELLKLAKTVAISHHEKWDGSGYPNGLSGNDIPLCARIVAIADVFDALTSERPYKKPWSIEQATVFLQEQSGKHFDPYLVPLFLNNLEEVIAIKSTFKD
ncbi:response regulator [Shewanella sp. WXL01]|uniref:HD domain-containing phosphohydrolase n=1 Tax=Shewanella sp. WXL01 TaxID=2709721 RepID=UPI001438370A|nr:HD domain-containing phosphohydrolase [Shewanella sp. WXL01]NKF50530.1 response regulator [Shewanella sp. WXL01]